MQSNRVRVRRNKSGGAYFSSPKTSIEWRQVSNFPHYQVANNGQVRRNTRLLKPQRKSGHLSVSLRRDGKTYNVSIPQALLLAFGNDRPSKKHGALHKDDNIFNNHIDNLYWGTQKENGQDAIRNNRTTTGSKNAMATVTENIVHKIKYSTSKGCVLAQKYQVSEATISRIRAGKTWRHV